MAKAHKSKREGAFILIYSEWADSEAYRSMSPASKLLLNEFLFIYRTWRSNQLSISVANAQRLIRVSKNSIQKAFHELVEHGFLVLQKHHEWQNGKAREWRLTIETGHNNTEPTDDWKRWRPGQPVATLPGSKKSRG